ncbi:MAG TPA: hypothetical protein VLJ14_08995 [Ktedonobacterales bacterium]|jgi:hypothetical protein|nr:hypothetical protein [Ktedonobacterales bacterium]
MAVANGGGRLCPNCKARPATTETHFDEVVFADMRVAKASRMRSAYSQRSVTKYGTVLLCAECAAAYRRNVTLRANGLRFINWGGAGLLVGALLFAFLAATFPSLTDGAAIILPALPLLAAIALLVVGIVMRTVGTITKRSAARFV